MSPMDRPVWINLPAGVFRKKICAKFSKQNIFLLEIAADAKVTRLARGEFALKSSGRALFGDFWAVGKGEGTQIERM